MVEKKVSGVKSVTLGDVNNAGLATGIKSTPVAAQSSAKKTDRKNIKDSKTLDKVGKKIEKANDLPST